MRGLDLGVLGTVPLIIGLLLGEVPGLLLAVALGWSLLLALVSVETAQRKP